MITIDQSKECKEVELSKDANEFEVLFATGVVNPHGPTFNVYYIDMSANSEAKEVFQVTLHPTADSIQNVATVNWDSSGETFAGINFFSDFFGGSLPTLFMKGDLLKNEFFHQIISMYIDFNDDSLETYNYVKQYEGKPFQRVSAEMRDAYESITEEKAEQRVGFFRKIFGAKSKEVKEVDNKHFIKLLTNEINVIEEIKALFMAYIGSIENVIPAGMVQLDFKEFMIVFTHVAIQCNIDLDKLQE
jgi:hypothetical protein